MNRNQFQSLALAFLCVTASGHDFYDEEIAGLRVEDTDWANECHGGYQFLDDEVYVPCGPISGESGDDGGAGDGS